MLYYLIKLSYGIVINICALLITNENDNYADYIGCNIVNSFGLHSAL